MAEALNGRTAKGKGVRITSEEEWLTPGLTAKRKG